MVQVFVPASVGNVGPGFDVLGMAITGPGDTVRAAWTDASGVQIDAITGGDGSLPTDPKENTAGIAAAHVLSMAGETRGVALSIDKGIPGTGLGSSAASAVAGAYAVNALLDDRFTKEALMPACIAGEQHVSGGLFLDNLGASLFGGVVACHTGMGVVWPLGVIDAVHVVVVTPEVKVLTRTSRGKLAATVSVPDFVHNMGAACSMVAAVGRNDAVAFGQAIDDRVIEPQRAELIAGFPEVKQAALKAGALGCSISGAGASVFAVTADGDTAASIGKAMLAAFADAGSSATVTLSRMDPDGARRLP